jgi:Helix-turn-helix domain
MPSLLTQSETALLLRMSPHTLACWRSRSEGPPYTKLGGKILYRHDALLTWLAARTQAPANA